jgi:hypothetical protein
VSHYLFAGLTLFFLFCVGLLSLAFFHLLFVLDFNSFSNLREVVLLDFGSFCHYVWSMAEEEFDDAKPQCTEGNLYSVDREEG